MSNETQEKKVVKTKEQIVADLVNGITCKVTAGIGKKSGKPYLALVPEITVPSGSKQLGDMVFVDNRGYALFEVFCELLAGVKADEIITVFEQIKKDKE